MHVSVFTDLYKFADRWLVYLSKCETVPNLIANVAYDGPNLGQVEWNHICVCIILYCNYFEKRFYQTQP